MFIPPLSPARRADRLYAVNPVRPYGSSPFREKEPTRLPPGTNLYDSFDWGAPYRQAAETTAGWLRHSRQAQLVVRYSARRIKHNSSPLSIEKELTPVIAAINELRIRFLEAERYLRPELWKSIEQAMAHPAAAAFVVRDDRGAWLLQDRNDYTFNESSVELLIGPKGWITCLLKALEEPQSVKVLDLLRNDIPRLQPYTCYYNTMATYWPFPVSGMLLHHRL